MWFVYLALLIVVFNLWQTLYMTWLYRRRPEAWNLFVTRWETGSGRKLRPVRFLGGLWFGLIGCVGFVLFLHYVASRAG